MLVSVVVGARVLAGAERAQTVWVATRDLAPGSLVAPGDVAAARVRLFAHGDRYLGGASPPVGLVLRRGVGAHELLPFAALAQPGQDLDLRQVTVPVTRGHMAPQLQSSSLVDVYVTPLPKSAAAPGPPRLVVAGVTVLDRQSAGGLGGGGTEQPVVLQVRVAQVPLVLAAVAEGRIDLVGVPRQAEAAASGGRP